MKQLAPRTLTFLSLLFAQNLPAQCLLPLAESHTCNREISETCIGQSFIPDCVATINQITVQSNSTADINNVTLGVFKKELLGTTEVFTQNNITLNGQVNGLAVPTTIDLTTILTPKPLIIPPLLGGPINYYFTLESNVDLKLQAYKGLDNFLTSLCTAVITPALTSVGIDVDLGFELNVSASVLPVQSISFIGTNGKDKIVLQWETATEINNDFFDVEYRTNTGDFTSIGIVKSSESNSSTEKAYQFVHNQPAKGVNYYRLKQVNLDGKFEYSKIVTVNHAEKQGFVAYPNPVKDRLILQTDNDDIDNIKIYHINGQLIYTQNNGSNNRDIDVSNLLNGVYFVYATVNNETYMSKFVKN